MDFTNCSNIGNSREATEAYLQHLEDNNAISMLPTVVMLVVFAAVGLVGNILVLVVYSQKIRLNPTKVLIMTIASFDMVAILGAIPSEINFMMDSWQFNQVGACKAKVFLVPFTAVGGAISLLIVAVLRYRKVCRPYGWQVNIKQAIILSAIAAVIAFLFSIPYVVLFGSSTRKSPCPNIQGHECFIDDAYINTIWPLLNNFLFILLYLSLSVAMVVLYVLIGITAWKHSKLYGISMGAASKEHTSSNASSGSSSEQKQHGVSNSETVKAKFRSSENDGQGKIQTLFCCKENQATEKSEDGIEMKNFTTTTTDTETGSQNSGSKEGDGNPSTSDAATVHLGARVGNGGSGYGELSTSNEAGNGFRETGSRSDMAASLMEDRCSTGDEGNKEIYLEQGNKAPKMYLNHQNADVATTMKSQPQGRGKNVVKRRPLGRMTAMLVTITAIFVLGYLPFLSLSVFKNRKPKEYADLSVAESALFNLFFRVYFMNTASNPIVYSFCDMKFRRACIALLTCKSRRRV